MFDSSYADLLKYASRTKPKEYIDICPDPIVDHTIQLQKYHKKLEHLIRHAKGLNEIQDDTEKSLVLSSLQLSPKVPEICKNRKNFNLESIELSETAIKSILSKAIGRILYVQGYTGVSWNLLQELSNYVGIYLKHIISKMAENTPREEPISVESFELTLQQERKYGIEELYNFYCEKIVNFHDRLYLKCKELHEELEKFLKSYTEQNSDGIATQHKEPASEGKAEENSELPKTDNVIRLKLKRNLSTSENEDTQKLHKFIENLTTSSCVTLSPNWRKKLKIEPLFETNCHNEKVVPSSNKFTEKSLPELENKSV